MGRLSEPELSNGPLSPTSSSDELPDASLLSRRKRQLAAAQRRRGSVSSTPSLRTSHSDMFREEELSTRDPSSAHPSSELQPSGECASKGGFTGTRKLSWRQQNGRAPDDVSVAHKESIESIPRAEWTMGRRPSWRRSSAADGNGEKLDTEEHQPLMQLESGGAGCKAGLAGEAEQVGKGTTYAVQQLAEVGSNREQKNREQEGHLGADVLERHRQNGALLADQTIEVVTQKVSSTEGTVRTGEMQLLHLDSGVTGDRMDVQASAGLAPVNGHPAGEEEGGEQGEMPGFKESNNSGGAQKSAEWNDGENRRDCDAGGAPMEDEGQGDKGTQKGKDFTREEDNEQIRSERVLGTGRRRSASIAELKRLAAVEIRSRRKSETDVTTQQLSESDASSRTDMLRRAESQVGTDLLSPMDVAHEIVVDRVEESSADDVVAGRIKEDAQAAATKKEVHSEEGGIGPDLQLRAERVSTDVEMVHERKQHALEEEGRVANEEDQGTRVQRKGKRRTSGDILKGDWLTKAREIGAADWAVSTESAKGRSREDAGRGVKRGVESGGGGRRGSGRATDKRIAPKVDAEKQERGATAVMGDVPVETRGIPHFADEAALQARIRAEVDAAVQSAAATWQESLAGKLLDRTRNMVSFEMTRVWEEVKQARKQLREASEGASRTESASKEVERLRSELGRVREELTRVRMESKRDLEAGLGGVRKDLEGVRQGVKVEAGDDVAKLQEAMQSVREQVDGVRKEIRETKNGFGHSERNNEKLAISVSANLVALEELRSRVLALESKSPGPAKGSEEAVGSEPVLAMRTQKIEADLENLRRELSALQASVADVRNESEESVKVCKEEASSVRNETENLRGLVSRQRDVAKQVEGLRQELEQGLAGSDARVSKVERDMRASERALAQKLALVRGANGERLDDLEERLPSPAAEKAEAVACASKRTEDQLARVEERIGLMLGLVSKGGQDDRSPLDAAVPNNPLDVPQAVLALKERLELLEKRTAQSAPVVAGLANRVGAFETTLRELREANFESENKASGHAVPSERAYETDGKGSNARAHRGADSASSLEERLELVEQILILETGASDLRGFLNPKPANALSPTAKPTKPLSPRSPNPVLSPKPSNPKAVSGQQPPASADAKPRLASVERRLGGLEARLDALASNEAAGAAAQAETRARVQGLDKRVQGLHRNLDLEAQLSKRVAAAEWRLEQVASLVIANTRGLEAQVERAQEDSTLAKDAADLASGKCGALAAELVRLSKQLTGGTKERRLLAAAATAG
ncbi:hypothetical protein KFL_001580040 [Klebsormidium nitens]|uniref:Uncharacterized protein n=1 Tax=Klebsormidium nitens TaxID=105231 RepID=A0A1Y1HYF5_KLENI|nr:hypothetical protein KFL_001580040 [Klebsormidium nitens]|eukprot:GAQ83690.1 hypothetical protein KFL_001580040 [Klebsormidium nitens]